MRGSETLALKAGSLLPGDIGVKPSSLVPLGFIIPLSFSVDTTSTDSKIQNGACRSVALCLEAPFRVCSDSPNP